METFIAAEEVKTSSIERVIYERRAVRKYKDKPIDKAIIEQVIDAGRMAPSAMNKQPWKFYVLNDKETIKKFSDEIVKAGAKDLRKQGLKKPLEFAAGLFFSFDFAKKDDPIFHHAPAVIFITASVKDEWAALDIGMCSQNIMLAAKSLGLDTCPIGFAKYVMYSNIYSSLKVPKSEQVHLAIILGYGDEKPDVHKRRKDNIIYITQA